MLYNGVKKAERMINKIDRFGLKGKIFIEREKKIFLTKEAGDRLNRDPQFPLTRKEVHDLTIEIIKVCKDIQTFLKDRKRQEKIFFRITFVKRFKEPRFSLFGEY